MIKKGFVASNDDVMKKPIELQEVSIICQFFDVFSDKLPELPPNREIEFVFDLIPRAEPISKAP